MRGKVARIQINKNAKVKVSKIKNISIIKIGLIKDKNVTLEIIHIIIILAYSAIKIRAKDPLLYSVLKPETNSDSPSAKSNGVRFVSANVVINQIIHIGNIIKNNGMYC